MVTDRKPLRADAARNRERVLAAARAAMTAGDLSLQLNELARQAGVGVGTVYRNFPTRQALLEALADDRFEQLLAEVEAATAEPDAWTALTRLTRAAVAMALAEPGLAEVMVTEEDAGAGTTDRKRRLDAATDNLLRRARQDGRLAAEVDAEDLRRLLCGVLHAAANSPEPEVAAERYLTILLHGLRPPSGR